MSVSVDAGEVFAFAQECEAAASKLPGEIEPVVFKGSMKIKDHLVKEAQGSPHFKPVARAISFDIETGPTHVESEIGPEKGGPGSLANLAYFGAGVSVYRGGPGRKQEVGRGPGAGGGTLPDPQGALDAEAPSLDEYVGKILEGLL